MKVLVVGGGGREHAIVWKLKQSERIDTIYCAPGNGGIAGLAECVPVKALDVEGMVGFALEKRVDFVVVAPDDPLALGMVNAMEKAGLRTFGPSKEAARIESSKVFSKALMKKYMIPTAGYETFHDAGSALVYLETCPVPIVVKADGLALGKGVVITSDREEAKKAVREMMLDKKFGESGDSIIIEEFMEGREVTVLAFTDGKTVLPMVSSQDHKRAYDNDEGPNTGGMGAFSPSLLYTPEVAEVCMEKIFRPTIKALQKEGILFKGVLYFGLMLTPDGPKVVEYNARFGDPEAQVVLLRLKTDLLEIMEAVVEERLDGIMVEWEDCFTACIMLASGGYPMDYEKGHEISGLEQVETVVFHSGTLLQGGRCLTNGGRVLGITGTGKSLDEAIRSAYREAGKIYFKDMYYRRDIGRT
ncbi:MAG: phosphoribosylamine--glycine ligase [Clostridia bacterium]